MRYELHVRQSDDPVTFRVHSGYDNLAYAQKAGVRWCIVHYQDKWEQANEAQFALKEGWGQVVAYIRRQPTQIEALQEERTRLIMRLAEIEKELSGGNQ